MNNPRRPKSQAVKQLLLPPDKTLLLGRKPAANLFALISAQIMEAISPRPVVALTLVVAQTLESGGRVRQVQLVQPEHNVGQV